MASVVEEDFWFASSRPGASSTEIDAAERYVGRRLPESLRRLLLRKNGGVSNYSLFRKGDEDFSFLPVFSVDAKAGLGSLMRAYDVRTHFGAPVGVIPFAGQGESWWGLDYRVSEDEPSIVYRRDLENPIRPVAPSFDALLDGLIEE